MRSDEMDQICASENRPRCGQLVVRRVEHRPDVVLLHVAGELDLATAGQLERELWQAPAGATIIDLSGCGFLAASGITVLLRAAGRARQERRRVAVVAAHRTVTRVLRMTGADREFTTFAAVDDAVREVATPRPRESIESTQARSWSVLGRYS
jgi:anti-sigma B factor antagonist